MTINRHTMSTGDVARALGVSDVRVRQLDAELKPIRLDGPQRTRRYDPAQVQKLAARRTSR